ncbi:acetylglutamate kinase [Pradoshia sp.]
MKTIVIKCGGSIISRLSENFFASLAELRSEGYSFVFVHGGGPDINDMMDKFEVPVQFEKGLRKTTRETLEITEMVLAGKTNRYLAHKLQSHHFKAVGLNGSDGGILQAEHIDQESLGEVGRIIKVDTSLLEVLLSNDVCPVLTPISINKAGNKLNVNADTAAGAVAAALHAELCIFITDVDGIKDGSSIIERITEPEIHQMIDTGTIYGGMIPKVKAAIQAKHEGASKILITSGVSNFFSNSKWKGTFLGP